MRRIYRLELTKYASPSDIRIEDAFEAGLTATAYLESIGFLINNLDYSQIQEENSENTRVYFMALGEIIMSLSSEASSMLDMLDDFRRNVLKKEQ